MPFLAFEGPAGTGKTYQLIEEVRARAPKVLGTAQRVLGLTFMHGSRRRFDESFASKAEIRGRGHAGYGRVARGRRDRVDLDPAGLELRAAGFIVCCGTVEKINPTVLSDAARQTVRVRR